MKENCAFAWLITSKSFESTIYTYYYTQGDSDKMVYREYINMGGY